MRNDPSVGHKHPFAFPRACPGQKVRMLGKYLPFYIYVTFVLVVSLSRMAVGLTFGVDSLQYYYAYYGPTFVMPVLQIWILWDIYRRIVGYTKTSWSYPARFSMIASVMTILFSGRFLLFREGSRLLSPVSHGDFVSSDDSLPVGWQRGRQSQKRD